MISGEAREDLSLFDQRISDVVRAAHYLDDPVGDLTDLGVEINHFLDSGRAGHPTSQKYRSYVGYLGGIIELTNFHRVIDGSERLDLVA